MTYLSFFFVESIYITYRMVVETLKEIVSRVDIIMMVDKQKELTHLRIMAFE